MESPCFFSAAHTWNKKPAIVDAAAWSIAKGDYVGRFSGKTLAELQMEYADVELKEMDEAWKLHCDAYIEPPREITAEQYDEMLNVLPPVNWVRRSDAESFKMSELTTGNITSIYARIGDKFYALQNYMGMSHDDVIRLILSSCGNSQEKTP